MSSRHRKLPLISPAKESRFLLLLLLGVGVPLAVLTALISADTHVDLSELRAQRSALNGNEILGWTALTVPPRTGDHPPIEGEMVGMVGYMMDPYAKGSNSAVVKMFTLMPDAGVFTHPAHRDPDQMVSIVLRPSEYSPFKNRSLVWVQGRFSKVTSLKPDEPLYALLDSSVKAVSAKDLRSWFSMGE